jgi:DNA-binding CsgD family transcriptional regulator
MTGHQDKFFDTSSELLVYRYEGGMRFVRPEDRYKHEDRSAAYYTGHTLSDYLESSLGMYLGSVENRVQRINEADAVAIGCSSVKAAVGKTPSDFLETGDAERTVQHNDQAMAEKRVLITEETYLWDNSIRKDVIIIRCPIYDNAGSLVGCFAGGFVLGFQSIADSLSEIIQLGLWGPSGSLHKSTGILPGSQIDNTYLSKRETEVLQQIALGKSARVVGAVLGISQRTVESHLENIKRKLNVYSKAELVDKAVHTFYGK